MKELRLFSVRIFFVPHLRDRVCVLYCIQPNDRSELYRQFTSLFNTSYMVREVMKPTDNITHSAIKMLTNHLTDLTLKNTYSECLRRKTKVLILLFLFVSAGKRMYLYCSIVL